MTRTYTIGLALVLLGFGLLAAGSGAFTTADVDRSISVDVADDEDALLGLETNVTKETTAESNVSLDDTEPNNTTDINESDEPTGNETDDETNDTATLDEHITCQLEVTVTNGFSHAIDEVRVEAAGGSESFDPGTGESETATFELDEPGENAEVAVSVADERVSVDLTRSVATDECSG